MKWHLWIGAFLLSVTPLLDSADAQSIRAEQINEANLSNNRNSRPLVAKLQILLDRANFSPGVIDGRMGENVENALAAFQKEKNLSGNGRQVDEATWSKLTEAARDKVIVKYRIMEEDVKGPFTENIPNGFEEKKDLDNLSYTGPAELLAEKFHMAEDFLRDLNPQKDFSKAGTSIMVVNLEKPKDASNSEVRRIEVDTAKKQVRAYGDDDKVVAIYPATVGSEERPAPSGTLKITRVAENPSYTYNPKYKFEGVKSDKPFTIAPGPNNPVGTVWIDLSKEGYGIHGTPAPEKIGKTASHGCVRLTNWDAFALAKSVKPGVNVEFVGNL